MFKKWRKIEEKKMISGPYRKIIKKTFKLPNGHLSDFEIINEGIVVCVLAVTKDKKIVLAMEYRPGPEKILLELPGGLCNINETPIKAATRELMEETGYAGNIKFIQKNYQCAYSNRIKYCFIATDCKKINRQTLDKNEFIEVIKMNITDFKKHLKTGNLTDLDCAMLGLNYLKLL